MDTICSAQNLIDRDLAHIWHPCTQMKDHRTWPPVPIVGAEGPYLLTADGRRIIDAISSWWCKSLGHRQPVIAAAVAAQASQFEHIIMAGTTHPGLVRLGERLAAMCAPLDRLFFADNGSTGMEVAIKMALQCQQLRGAPQRTQLASLRGGYHGETLLTMGVSDCSLYSGPFAGLLPPCTRLGPLPYRPGPDAADWEQVSDAEWLPIAASLEPLRDTLAAVVFEPVVQGAGGMHLYSPDLLRRLRNWADANDVLLIADEIMTGLGRTGRPLACDHAGIRPDFLVLSKALTGGWLPMAVTLTRSDIYDAFWGDWDSGRAFLHSNTYAGNALAVAAANAALDVYETEQTFARVERDGPALLTRLRRVAESTGALTNLRGIGFVVAADLVDPRTGNPFPRESRAGWHVYQEGLRRGAWLRTLADTIYWLPPLNCHEAVLDDLADITSDSIQAVVR